MEDEKINFGEFYSTIRDHEINKAFYEKPFLNEILSFLESKVAEAKLNGAKRNEWQGLESLCETSRAEYKAGGIEKACWGFFHLGMRVNQLENDSSERKIKLINLEIANDRRMFSFTSKNIFLKFAKDTVQFIANEIWKTDIDNSIRTTEMSRLVWGMLLDGSHKKEIIDNKYFPNDMTGLKPWIKEIAPDYAKKGGRPKTPKQ